MMEKIKELTVKYREIIVYVIVGFLTTMVSWFACWIAKFFLDTDITWQNSLVQVIGWCAGVAFAFPTNRRWVFQSRNPDWKKELVEFVSSRIGTMFLEILIMDITVNAMHIDYWVAKIFICTVIIMVTNYVLSKFWVFKKKKGEKTDDNA